MHQNIFYYFIFPCALMKKLLLSSLSMIVLLGTSSVFATIRVPVTTLPTIIVNTGSTSSSSTSNSSSSFDTTPLTQWALQVSLVDFQNLKKEFKAMNDDYKALKKDYNDLKKQFNDLKTQHNDTKTQVVWLKWLLWLLNTTLTKLSEKFVNHTHSLNGYTSEWASMVNGWNDNLIYLHRSNKITKEKREKLKETGKPLEIK